MRTAISTLLVVILLPLALYFSFFSFMFRADSWEEVAHARYLNFLLIGPLWAVIAFFAFRPIAPSRPLLAIFAACAIYLMSAASLSSWTALVFRIRIGRELTESDASENRPVVQAICEYRADKGMLPYSLEDLVPRYLATVPDSREFRWDSRRLIFHRRILYFFERGNEGWAPGLDLPKVASTRPTLSGESLIQARIAEYDRRIANAPKNEDHQVDKIAYLISIDRRSEARNACREAAASFPESWRPLMGLATFSEGDDRSLAEVQLRDWFDAHPSFIRFWVLSRYYRTLGRHNEALEALRQAVKYPLEDVRDESQYVPNAYAFDAAKYAYQQSDYELVIEITRVWSSPRGIYSNPGDDWYAFRAAAELALGRVDEAKKDMDFVCNKHEGSPMWAGNLRELQQATAIGDRTFVYDPGSTVSIEVWKFLRPSDERD